MAKQSLELVCQQLASNDPTLTSLDMNQVQRSPNWAVLLGNALVGNTHLHFLTIDHDDSKNTTDKELKQAEALGAGIAGSNVKELTFTGGGRYQNFRNNYYMLWPMIQSAQCLRCICFYAIHLKSTHSNYKFAMAPNTRQLGLCNVTLDEEAAQSLAAGIRESSVEDLCLYHLLASTPAELVRIWQVLLEAARQSTSIRALRLRGAPAECLPTLFERLCTIETLSLGDPKDQNDGIVYATICANILAESTAKLSQLTLFRVLNLALDNGVAKLARGLQNNRSLTLLRLVHCNLQANGAVELLRVRTAHRMTCSLCLFQDHTIGYAGLRTIAKELETTQWTDVNILECVPSIENATQPESQAEALIKHHAAQALVHAVAQNRRIARLRIEGNGFSKEIERSIAFHSLLNYKGWPRLASHHEMAHGKWHQILASCNLEKDLSSSLLYFYLQEVPTLVNKPRAQKAVQDNSQRDECRILLLWFSLHILLDIAPVSFRSIVFSVGGSMMVMIAIEIVVVTVLYELLLSL